MTANATLAASLLELRTGTPKPLAGSKLISGIDKAPRQGSVPIGALGIAGDEQADRRFHGGVDKAVLHYASEHYEAWRAELPDLAERFGPGGFGENLVTTGMDETTVCLGDRFTLGTALLEVTQPRQPCFKLNHRFGHPRMARLTQDTGRTGWYYRVLAPGAACAGDRITLCERRHPDWPLRRVQEVLYRDRMNVAALESLVAIKELAEAMSTLFAGRLQSAQPESWKARLTGLGVAPVTIYDESQAEAADPSS